jgi:GMP synthase-like glutamine amidotransferase
MRVHHVRHVPYEGLGNLRQTILQGGHEISESRPWEGVDFPSPDRFDALIVLGGPMGVCDFEPPAWMDEEKSFLADTIAAGRPVLGICLGAQLLASVLGAEVRRHVHAEVGWHRLEPTPEGADGVLSPFFAPGVHVMQWHQDTFDIPAGAVRLCGSEACANQAFAWDDRVLGLQFHPEMTHEEAGTVLARDRVGAPGRFVQTAAEILRDDRFSELRRATRAFASRLLDDWQLY